MFANFELSSGGLVAADVKPKRTRTDLGCLPCTYLPHYLTRSHGPVRISCHIAGRLYLMCTLELTPFDIRSEKEKEV